MNSKATETLDLHANSLLATVFTHPAEVLADALLSADQKRCVLAAWASDAFAVEDKPWLRLVPGCSDPIPLSEILSALRSLDEDDDPPRPGGQSAFPIRLNHVARLRARPAMARYDHARNPAPIRIARAERRYA